ncbi:hypothetical protein ACFQY0_03925 [Haloferula chungangensis]|uniref:Uncharacterized protein n=1 Tax=Haloferula chungangensis TaxID=1048331 RepID=A0ABW2L1V2_9BACT
MSSREKKLLIFFLTAIFAVVNMFGFQWLQKKRLSVQQEIVAQESILNAADTAESSKEIFIQEIDWLEDNTPDPKEGELVPSQLENLVTTEATRAGLTVVRPKILDNDESGLYYNRARFEIAVSGNEAALYRWLVRLHSPRDFRAITALRLSPNREDDTLIDANVQVEQWFVPAIAELSE